MTNYISKKPAKQRSQLNTSKNSAPVFNVEKFETLRSAAEILGLPVSTLRSAVRADIIPTYKFGQSRVLVRISEIIAIIDRSPTWGDDEIKSRAEISDHATQEVAS